MTAVSFSVNRGVSNDMNPLSSLTIGTLAPNANDVELRFNTTDANGKNMNDKDIIIALENFRRAILQNGTTVDVSLSPSGPP